MTTYRADLPQLDADVFLTDGGIETTLIFDDGFDLPDFAAFVLLDDEAGRAAMVRYYESYVATALRDEVGIVLETATWRANADWSQGLTPEQLAEVNRDAVDLLVDVRRRLETPATPIVISGCIGPRGDGYVVESAMTVDQARDYHAAQIQAFADSDADLVTALTMTYAEEATGVVEAARAAGMPVVISFTVETDGRLPSGQDLSEAIAQVDEASGSYASYFMVNCAHPTHFAHVFGGAPAWTSRVAGVRANASRLSHAELDEAPELDRGDPLELATAYRQLRDELPTLRVLGGCCGTDHRHVDAISAAVRSA